jgi:hypothetical protein
MRLLHLVRYGLWEVYRGQDTESEECLRTGLPCEGSRTWHGHWKAWASRSQ